MVCPKCTKEILPDAYFCTWCGVFTPAPERGARANLAARWLALMLDPLIALALYLLALAFVGAVLGSGDLVVVVAVLFPLAYVVWFLALLRQGLTPGKKLLGLQVLTESGAVPGFGRMFLREIVGRFLSGLFLGIGYLWALFDKNRQAWHDKLAGTVVVRSRQRA